MDLLSTYLNSNTQVETKVIDITNAVQQEDVSMKTSIYNDFTRVVSDIRVLIESNHQPIVSCKASLGKDSLIVVIASIAAYKASIEAGKIEASRPLLITTVSTLVESIVMDMFVRYTKKSIESYCCENNINLTYNLVEPDLNSEYFIKWASNDKMINNPLKSGDCTNILKLDPALKNLAILRKTICKNKRVISFVGSRKAESTRRSTNMIKQNIANKAVSNLLTEMETTSINTELDFAPISEWSDDDVFGLLRIAGDNPLDELKSGVISTFLDDFSLILEIYGKASTGRCEVVLSNNKVKAGGGCGGSSARYGCHFCTQIVTDKSTIALAEKTYWKVLGVENALRVRDWLFRASFDEQAKTHHPKAVDPCLNRIIYQPNVLKSRKLSKMITYASQLTVDSINSAKKLATLIAENREDEHEGVAAIKADMNIHPKAKAAFLKMYLSEASKPLMNYFSQKHAVYLSFLWALNGVSAVNYEPLSIWRNISNGKSRIPYPKLNTELPVEKTTLKSTPALEPIALRFHTKEFESNFFENGSPSFLSFWQKPVTTMDIFPESNCMTDDSADHTNKVKTSFSIELAFNYTSEHLAVTFKPSIESIKHGITGRNVTKGLITVLNEEISDYITEKAYELLYSDFYNDYLDLVDSYEINDQYQINSKQQNLINKFSSFNKISTPLRYFSKHEVNTGYRDLPLKVNSSYKWTQRVTKKSPNGTLNKTTTRCRFYKPSVISTFEEKYKVSTEIMKPNFNTTEREAIQTLDYDDNVDDVNSPITICNDRLQMWVDNGGLEKALNEHDSTIAREIKHRHTYRKNGSRRGTGIRRYNGVSVISNLMLNAGVLIKPKYIGQFESKLRRTQLLDEIGAFELQVLNRKDLLAHKNAVSMKQHRTDKANYLLKVRAARNERRKNHVDLFNDYKVNPVLMSVSHTESVISDLFKLATTQLEQIKYILTGNDFDFNGLNVNSNTMIKSINVWVAMYHDALTDYTKFKKLLINKKMTDVLALSATSEIKVNDHFISLSNAFIAMAKENLKPEVYNLLKRSVKEEKAKDVILNKMNTQDKVSTLAALLTA